MTIQDYNQYIILLKYVTLYMEILFGSYDNIVWTKSYIWYGSHI